MLYGLYYVKMANFSWIFDTEVLPALYVLGSFHALSKTASKETQFCHIHTNVKMSYQLEAVR